MRGLGTQLSAFGPAAPPVLDLSTLTLNYFYHSADYVFTPGAPDTGVLPGRTSVGTSGAAAKVLLSGPTAAPTVGPLQNGMPTIAHDQALSQFLVETTPANVPTGTAWTFAAVCAWSLFGGAPNNAPGTAFNNSGLWGDYSTNRINLAFRSGNAQVLVYDGAFHGVETFYANGAMQIVMARGDGVNLEIRIGTSGPWTSVASGLLAGGSNPPSYGRATNPGGAPGNNYNGTWAEFIEASVRYDDDTCDAIAASLAAEWRL